MSAPARLRRLAGASVISHTRCAMGSGEQKDDEALMEAYRDGDAGAFEVLYRRHRGGVYRYLLRQVRSAGEAEELFQDVWVNVVRARARYVARAKFTTWLYRIAHNRLIDHYRRGSLVFAPPAGEDEEDPLERIPGDPGREPERQTIGRAQVERFLSLLEALPPAQREAFVLHQEDSMSVDEIAAATGVNRETAKSRLRYALARLRQGMREWL